jgi:prepilin-type N-terminal cleavage/methylation domain-containing protein
MKRTDKRGFTLVELVLVIVIAGILVTVALRSAGIVSDTAKVEETKQELEALTCAIVGNPELQNNGVRSDFGYTGDIGSLPLNLDALHSNPGSYSTWKGPYIENRFSQDSDDFKKDAWGELYQYSAGVTITSVGGSGIVRKLANSTADLLQNQVSGAVYDLDGTPPGNTYDDSVVLRLTIPNGTGGMLTKTANPDDGGYFSFDSIPIGNHDIQIIYQPDDDTLKRFVSVIPNSSLYSEYYLAADVWYDTTGGAPSSLTKVTGSDSLYSDCHGFFFWIENNTGSQVSVDSVTLTWSSPTAYYRYIKWDGTTVFNENNPRAGSGEKVGFTSTQTINNGQSLRVDFDSFKSNPSGGPDVDMDNVTFTVDFSDGSSITVTTGNCP